MTLLCEFDGVFDERPSDCPKSHTPVSARRSKSLPELGDFGLGQAVTRLRGSRE
jgi:hypothetical protein